jgi:transposase-like protein
MVTIVVRCYHCGSKKLVKNGHAPNGKQKYGCKDCGKASRENPAAKGYDEKKKEEILSAYQERSSMRGLTRTFGIAAQSGRGTAPYAVSRITVTKWLKKSPDAGRT